MPIDYSKFKIAALFGRTNAQLAKILLEQAGIKVLLKQDISSETLSVTRGNAVMPFESWGLYVAENNLLTAKELLGGLKTGQHAPRVKEPAARRAVKPFIWMFLILFFGGIIFAFGFMIREIISTGKI